MKSEPTLRDHGVTARAGVSFGDDSGGAGSYTECNGTLLTYGLCGQCEVDINHTIMIDTYWSIPISSLVNFQNCRETCWNDPKSYNTHSVPSFPRHLPTWVLRDRNVPPL